MTYSSSAQGFLDVFFFFSRNERLEEKSEFFFLSVSSFRSRSKAAIEKPQAPMSLPLKKQKETERARKSSGENPPTKRKKEKQKTTHPT